MNPLVANNKDLCKVTVRASVVKETSDLQMVDEVAIRLTENCGSNSKL